MYAERARIDSVRKGDEFHHEDKCLWRAVGDAMVDGERVSVDIQVFPDGGLTTRTWHTGHVLPIWRAVA